MTDQELLTVQEQITESVQAQENLEALRDKGELGNMFADLYEVAIGEEPELAEVKVWTLGSDAPGFDFLKQTGGAAKHRGKSKIGRHELVMNTDDGLAHYEKLLNSRRTSAEICAKKVGIEDGTMTPEQLASFVFLHELGHIVDFIKNAPDLDVKEERREKDMSSLPFPNWNPAGLINFLESPEGDRWFKDSSSVLKNFGIASKEDMISLQETAYHGLETEDIPDQFAAKIMKKQGMV